jgi:hypothetical protein
MLDFVHTVDQSQAPNLLDLIAEVTVGEEEKGGPGSPSAP